VNGYVPLATAEFADRVTARPEEGSANGEPGDVLIPEGNPDTLTESGPGTVKLICAVVFGAIETLEGFTAIENEGSQSAWRKGFSRSARLLLAAGDARGA
jgi:hypothetical protein